MTKSTASSASPRYSIVVPCFNEQDSIGPLVREIVAMIGGDEAFEIVIVDDCSVDQTMARLIDMREELVTDLRVVSHAVNCGQSAAVCTGVEVARGAWIATLDGDGQNDPRDVAKLIGVLDEQLTSDTGPVVPPIICGHRLKRNDSWVKRLSSRFANGVRSRLLNDVTPDTGCGLKLMNRAAFLRLPRFDHMHRFLPALMQREGAQVISVTVGHRPRRAGISKYGIHNRLWVGIVDLVGVIWLGHRNFKPTDYKEF